MALEVQWKNPAGRNPDQLYRWGQDLVTQLRKGRPPPLSDFLNLQRDFGAKGDGVADDSAAIQAACNSAVTKQKALFVPAALIGYKINTAINLTNLNGALTIFGEGIVAPTFGLAVTPPIGGSLFLGNTGTGKPVFDCCGSNNIIFKDLNIKAIGQSTPSTVGLLFGTSTTSPSAQTPGGSNCSLENVAVYMANANNSIPIYYVAGAGNSHFYNVWTLGVYGIAISSSNNLAISSPYVTIGSGIGIDGISANGCNLLGYGAQFPLYIEGSNNHSWDQLYIDTINGGPSYSGQPYAIFLQNVIDIRMKVEVDFMPTVVQTVGSIDSVYMTGTTFPNTTPVPTGQALIAFFNGTDVKNCDFLVQAVSGLLPNSNYFYTSVGGASPTLNRVRNTRLLFNNGVSPNGGFLNFTNTDAVPLSNVDFRGDVGDTLTNSLNIAGAAATADKLRYTINGDAPVQTYTPTPGTQGGSSTFGTVTGRWKRVGHLIWLEVSVTVTTANTGTGFISATLPPGLSALSTATFGGAETAVTFKGIKGIIAAGANPLQMNYDDATSIIANGATAVCSGWFEANP